MIVNAMDEDQLMSEQTLFRAEDAGGGKQVDLERG